MVQDPVQCDKLVADYMSLNLPQKFIRVYRLSFILLLFCSIVMQMMHVYYS